MCEELERGTSGKLLLQYFFQPQKHTDQLDPVDCVGGVLAVWDNPQLLMGVAMISPVPVRVPIL